MQKLRKQRRTSLRTPLVVHCPSLSVGDESSRVVSRASTIVRWRWAELHHNWKSNLEHSDQSSHRVAKQRCSRVASRNTRSMEDLFGKRDRSNPSRFRGRANGTHWSFCETDRCATNASHDRKFILVFGEDNGARKIGHFLLFALFVSFE